MAATRTQDIEATLGQVRRIEAAGARALVVDMGVVGTPALVVDGDGARAADPTTPRPDLRIPGLDALSHLVAPR